MISRAYHEMNDGEVELRKLGTHIWQTVQPGGYIEAETEVLASYASGTCHWEITRPDDLDVRLYAGIAIEVGRRNAKGVNGPVACDDSARFIAVW